MKQHLDDPSLVLGPLLIGTVFNAFIYGICVLQFSSYWENKSNDPSIIKLLVGWTFLLDTFHTCALIYMLWVYVIVEYNNSPFLAMVLWPFSATPIVTTLTSCPIEIFLSWRIKQFSKSRRVFFGLILLALAQASLGFTCSIIAYQIPDIASYHRLIPFVDAWQVSAVVADGSITDNVISRLIRSSIETAAFGAFFCIMDLITFTTLQRTNFHVIFAFPLGRIYTNTLLMNLNSRSSLRAELERPIIPEFMLDQSDGPPCASDRGIYEFDSSQRERL
ncbi:hypothetical protein BDZ97DRAFT_1936903 [Flammula alnicola]|nr:hypothetical protein BDZ97DRAFT_1936903 [Flammula alnicola]